MMKQRILERAKKLNRTFPRQPFASRDFSEANERVQKNFPKHWKQIVPVIRTMKTSMGKSFYRLCNGSRKKGTLVTGKTACRTRFRALEGGEKIKKGTIAAFEIEAEPRHASTRVSVHV